MNNFNNIFEYKIYNKSNIPIRDDMINLIEKVFNKWSSIITYNPTGRIIGIDIFFEDSYKNPGIVFTNNVLCK